jgi:hypothetical protein
MVSVAVALPVSLAVAIPLSISIPIASTLVVIIANPTAALAAEALVVAEFATDACHLLGETQRVDGNTNTGRMGETHRLRLVGQSRRGENQCGGYRETWKPSHLSSCAMGGARTSRPPCRSSQPITRWSQPEGTTHHLGPHNFL